MQDWPGVHVTPTPLEAQLWRFPQEIQDQEELRWLETWLIAR